MIERRGLVALLAFFVAAKITERVREKLREGSEREIRVMGY